MVVMSLPCGLFGVVIFLPGPQDEVVSPLTLIYIWWNGGDRDHLVAVEGVTWRDRGGYLAYVVEGVTWRMW